MKSKEKLLTKIEKLAAPVMIVSETHAITLVILGAWCRIFHSDEPIGSNVCTYVYQRRNTTFIGGLVYGHRPTKASTMGNLLLR